MERGITSSQVTYVGKLVREKLPGTPHLSKYVYKRL
jgi:hypothetical protein